MQHDHEVKCSACSDLQHAGSSVAKQETGKVQYQYVTSADRSAFTPEAKAHLKKWVSVQLFSPHQGSLECIHTCTKDPDQWGKQTLAVLGKRPLEKGNIVLGVNTALGC